MILSTDYLKNNMDEIIKHPYNYMILSMKDIVDSDTFSSFEYGLNILYARNVFEMVNQLWRNMGVKRELDVSIFNEVTDAIYSQKPFSEKQIKEYFTVMKEFEGVVKAFRSFNGELETVCIDSDIELMLLGWSFDWQKQTVNSDKLHSCDGLVDQYSDIKWKYFEGEIDLKKFLSQVDKLFNEAKKSNGKAA